MSICKNFMEVMEEVGFTTKHSDINPDSFELEKKIISPRVSDTALCLISLNSETKKGNLERELHTKGIKCDFKYLDPKIDYAIINEHDIAYVVRKKDVPKGTKILPYKKAMKLLKKIS